MVGVPGRSKGCATCRKRKKGCDLKQPSCGQCEARGLVCGGYDPDRIFVNAASASSASTLLAKVPPNRRRPDSILAPTQPDSFKLQICNTSQFNIWLSYGLANSAYREKTLEVFFSMYLPHCDHDNRDRMIRQNNFTNVISFLYGRDEAVKLGVIALGAAMLGKIQGEKEWMRQGRKLYGRALRETRRALLDEKRVNSEALLLVPGIGALFEMLFGADMNSTVQAQSWRSHAHGELAILKARGPHGLQDDIAHQIFVDSRLPVIIAAIRMRKASVLNNVEWKTIPWEKRPKTPKDTLFDVMLGIPEILEGIDNLHPGKNDAIEDAARASITTKCRKLEAELETWAKVNEVDLASPDTENPIKIAFRDASTAYLTIYYWTTSLFIYGTLAVVSPAETHTSHSLLLRPRDATLYAHRIARAVPYFLDSSCGIWGATAVAFPMGITLLCLLHDGTEKNKEYLRLVYEAWNNPALPSAIHDFLNSMRRNAVEESEHGRPRFSGEFWVP